MRIIKCWDIQVWDGGDRCNHKYFVFSEEAALEWKKNNRFDSIYEREFIIFDNLEEIKKHASGEARKRALAKLTNEDKFALGIKD